VAVSALVFVLLGVMVRFRISLLHPDVEVYDPLCV
jgi:hypothetical protein